MISNNQENFLTRHYEWLVAGVGGLALIAAAFYFVLSLGEDADAAASEEVRRYDRRAGAETGVEKPDLTNFEIVMRAAKTPALLAEISDRQESFLASERRVKCTCGKILPGGLTTCPACQKSLVVVNKVDEEAKKVDAWKKRYGVEMDGLDADKDGFTNQEEYLAKTDPTDAKDHPDYLDSLTLTLPLKETTVPFFFVSAMQIPNGWRCTFLDPKQKDDFGRLGRKFTAVIGEEIGTSIKKPTDFILKNYEPRTEKRAIAGGKNMTKSVDVSVATIERKSDGKQVDLVVQTTLKGTRLAPIDVQATLLYSRGGTQNFEVVTGSTIDLNGTRYKVLALKAVGKGAEITLENMLTGKKRVLKALE